MARHFAATPACRSSLRRKDGLALQGQPQEAVDDGAGEVVDAELEKISIPSACGANWLRNLHLPSGILALGGTVGSSLRSFGKCYLLLITCLDRPQSQPKPVKNITLKAKSFYC